MTNPRSTKSFKNGILILFLILWHRLTPQILLRQKFKNGILIFFLIPQAQAPGTEARDTGRGTPQSTRVRAARSGASGRATSTRSYRRTSCRMPALDRTLPVRVMWDYWIISLYEREWSCQITYSNSIRYHSDKP